MIEKFKQPIYVTRPYLPPLSEVIQELQEIWENRWLTNMGPKHQQFEKAIRESLSVEHLSLFNNGMSALMVAVKTLSLQGEVITTPFTFAATPNALIWNNVTPVFVDVDSETLTIDAKQIEKAITPRTSGILGVHVFGIPCNVQEIDEIAKRNNLQVVYDAAHAFQTTTNGKPIGHFGDATIFSFHATKLFHTVEGGALVVKNVELKKRADLLKNFGIKNELEVLEPGMNGKMNELQAAIGLVVLRHLQGERMRRKVIKENYGRFLKDIEGVTVVREPEDVESSYQYFVIRVQPKSFGATRDELYQHLMTYNIFSRKYFYPLCSNFTHFRHLPSASPKNLPVANAVAEEVLSLPFYGDLTERDIAQICEAIATCPKSKS